MWQVAYLTVTVYKIMIKCPWKGIFHLFYNVLCLFITKTNHLIKVLISVRTRKIISRLVKKYLCTKFKKTIELLCTFYRIKSNQINCFSLFCCVNKIHCDKEKSIIKSMINVLRTLAITRNINQNAIDCLFLRWNNSIFRFRMMNCPK